MRKAFLILLMSLLSSCASSGPALNLSQEINKVCQVLITPPQIVWLDNAEQVTILFNAKSANTFCLDKVWAFYETAQNRIFFSKQDYSSWLLHHELTHVVLTQIGFQGDQEEIANRVANTLNGHSSKP